MIVVIMGYFLGNVLFNFTARFINADPKTLYLINIIAAIVVLVILGIMRENLFVVLFTTIFGAYASVRVCYLFYFRGYLLF